MNCSRRDNNIGLDSSYACRAAWVLLLTALGGSPLFAANSVGFDIGCGDPALHICYESADRYMLFVNDRPPEINQKDIHSGGYFVGWPKQRTVLDSRGNQTNDDHGPFALYAFGEQTAFTCPYGGSGWASDKDAYDPAKYRYWPRTTQMFKFTASDAKGACILVSEDVYGMACSKYGLATNQLFLGKIGTNVFYWETRDPRKVYFRGVKEKQAVSYFALPKGVLDIYGVTKPLRRNEDVAIWAMRRWSRWGHWIIVGSPYEDKVFEFSFKTSRRTKDSQQSQNKAG